MLTLEHPLDFALYCCEIKSIECFQFVSVMYPQDCHAILPHKLQHVIYCKHMQGLAESLSEGSCKPTEQACLCKAPKVLVYTKAIIVDSEDAQPARWGNAMMTKNCVKQRSEKQGRLSKTGFKIQRGCQQGCMSYPIVHVLKALPKG